MTLVCTRKALPSNKDTILIDLDGVLSPLGESVDKFTVKTKIPYAEWYTTKKIQYAMEVLARYATLVSISTWEEDSIVFAKKAGYPITRFLKHEYPMYDQRWFKADAIHHFLEKNQDKRIVIFDDELSTQKPEFTTLRSEWNKQGVFIPIIDGETGLNKDIMHKTLKFLCSDIDGDTEVKKSGKEESH